MPVDERRITCEKSARRSSRGAEEAARPTVYEMPSLMLIIIFHEGWPLKMVCPWRCLRWRTLCFAGW